jgi:ribonuclease J
VLLAEDGDVLAVSDRGARKEARVPAGRILLDRASNAEVDDVVVRDRRRLSAQGVVVPIVVVDRLTGRLESEPEIVTRGVADADEAAELTAEAGRVLAETINGRPKEERLDLELTRERIRRDLQQFLRRRTQRRPLVIPVVMEV